MVNPFDPETVLLAKHAQHVVLVHFPIALFLSAVGFDFGARWTKKTSLAIVARYNLAISAIATLPVIATGLAAWQWQLGGHKLKGILLQHVALAVVSSGLIWLVWWLRSRADRSAERTLPTWLLSLEMVAALAVAVTAHLGGFLSGVNAPG